MIKTEVYLKRNFLLIMALLVPSALQAQTSFTHMHMRVPDTAESAAWHAELFGREIEPRGPGPDIVYPNGNIATMVHDGENGGVAPPSQGGVIDHFGIAVADVEATVAKALEMGATLKTAPQVGVTAETIAFIEDPWGVRMELLEDPVYLGVNHLHMMAYDPDAMHQWFLEVFGGVDIPARGKSIFHTILYGDVWVHISSPNPGFGVEPSRGRALDHLGFSVSSIDEFRTTLLASGYEPYEERGTPGERRLMFFEGPEGLHFEITEEVSGSAEHIALLEDYVETVNNLDIELAKAIWSQRQPVTFIQPRGHQRGFEQIEQNFYLGAMANFSERNLTLKNLSVHSLSEDTAWAEFYWDFEATFTDGTPLTSSGRESQVWVREDDGWKIVHVHYSGMPTQEARQGF